MKAPKKHLCFVLCLVLLASLFTSCQTNEFRIYHEAAFCSCHSKKVWYTPYASDSFLSRADESLEYTEDANVISPWVQFQWGKETMEGKYLYSKIVMKKGMFDLKQDMVYDVYSTPGDTGYRLYVDRQTGHLLSCSSFGKEEEGLIDIGAAERVKLLEQALDQCENALPPYMRPYLEKKIDPDGYKGSCSLWLKDAQLFGFGVQLFSDGSILQSGHGGSLQGLSRTNMEILEGEYEKLSSERMLQAIDQRLDWLYQTPRKDTVFMKGNPNGEDYLLYRKGEWTSKNLVYELGYKFAPNGRLYRTFCFGVNTKLTPYDGQELYFHHTLILHISVY